MTRRFVLGRILLRGFLIRPARTLTALAAVVVGAGVVSAALAIYINAHAKLHTQFRGYGANIVLSAAGGHELPQPALAQVEALLPAGGAAAPFAFAVANSEQGAPVVVAGSDFSRARALDSWWSVSAWPAAPHGALVGARTPFASRSVPFTLVYAGKPLTLQPAGILRTGGEEESRIYISLPEFSSWTGVGATTIEIYFPGSPAAVQEFARRLARTFPGAQAQPVREITETEGRVLEKTRSTLVACVIVIAVIALLTVVATLTASVLDRRRDFALMKALGATQRSTRLLFAAETAILGASGGIIGYILGVGAAAVISRSSFHFRLHPPLALLPEVVAGSIVVALIAAILPLRLLRKLQPAAILKGE